MGASSGSIARLLAFEFLSLVILAFLLAPPLAYHIATEWLNEFTFRIDLSIWIFAVAAVASILLATITVGYHTLGAAKANPVEALRSE